MKVILFGANGMLGTYLKTYLSDKYNVLALTRADMDITKVTKDEFIKFLSDNVSKGDVIINACGVIKQREYNLSDMIIVNSLFPHLLAEAKMGWGCEVIHITTDCVFSGIKGCYIERDKHDCIDDYGKSKSLGEHPINTNIRTSIIGEEKQNKKSLLEWVRSNEGKEIDGYDNHLWNGVTCLELSKLIHRIISSGEFWQGTRHVFSPDTVTKHDLVSYINEIYGLGITINKKTTPVSCYRNLSSELAGIINKTLYKQILELKEYDNN